MRECIHCEAEFNERSRRKQPQRQALMGDVVTFLFFFLTVIAVLALVT
jgi:hypothetical protein